MQRPRVKPALRPERFGHRRIRLGGHVGGIAVEILDESGDIWELLGLLDGTRSVAQVHTDLSHRPGGPSEEDIEGAVGQLAERGLLEDAAETTPAWLTDELAELHSRPRALWSWMDTRPSSSSWEFLERLRAARVCVVGVGGAGSVAATSLAALGVGALRLVDPDTIERSNLSRQLAYAPEDVGRPKVEVLRERLARHIATSAVTVSTETMTSADVAVGLMSDCDLFVLTADSPPAIRRWVNRAALRAGTPWVHGGYHGPRVVVGVYAADDGPCYGCGRIAHDRRESALGAREEWPAWEPAAEIAPANAVTAGVAGNLVAHAAASLITGAPALRVNCSYGLNLAQLDDAFVIGPDEPDPTCDDCKIRATR